MKKIISIFIVLLFLAVVLVGCNDDVESNKKQENETTVEASPQDNNSEAVEENNNENEITEETVDTSEINEKPEVIETLDPPEVYRKEKYYNYDLSPAPHKKFNEDSLDISAYKIEKNDVLFFDDEIHIFISFKTKMSTDTIDKIKFTSENILVKKKFWADDTSIGLILDSKEIEPFSLIVESGVKDINGLALKDDFTIKLRKVKYTTASAKLIADSGVFGSKNLFFLTDSPKVFEVTFSYPVDRESVEKTLQNDMIGNTKINFEWADDSHLTIKMSNLEIDKYLLSLDKAVDKNGVPIEMDVYGLLQFGTNQQTKVYSIDLNKDDGVQEEDIQYSKDIYWMDPIYIPKYNLLRFEYNYDIRGYRAYLYYDLNKNRVVDFTYNEKVEDITFEEVFNSDDYLLLDGDIFSYNGEFKNITYNGENYTELEVIDKDNGILVFNLAYGSKFTIYDKNNDELKEIPIDINNITLEGDSIVARNYILLNSGRIIIVEGLNPKTFFDLNLYKIDIETGDVKLLKEHAKDPKFFTEDTFLFRDSKGNLKISDLDGNIIEELPSGFSNYIGGNIVSSTSDSITIYNLKTKEKRIIPTDKDYQIIGGNESNIYLTK